MLKIKPEELKEIEHFANNHPTGRLLTEMKSWNFQTGDVLIRHIKASDGTRAVDVVSDSCPVPKKYRVIYIDSLGLPWIKQLSVRGGLGEKIYCLATVDANRYSYQVDPEQLEAILLGYKYDPRVEYKRMRTENPHYGGGNSEANKK